MSDGNRFLLSAQSINKSFGPRSAPNRDCCFRTRSRRLTRVGGLLSQLPNHWCCSGMTSVKPKSLSEWPRL